MSYHDECQPRSPLRIEDYGFLSDTETAALVGNDGSIDWLCVPRFDTGACFARLLGTDENGFWQIAPKLEIKSVRRRYRDHTLVLETDFATETGSVRLIDFMPLRKEFPEIVRTVEGLSGLVEMVMKMVIRFDYGLTIPWVCRHAEGLVAKAGPDGLILRSDVPTHGENLSTVAEFTVQKGERKSFTLTWFPSHREVPKACSAAKALEKTEAFWCEWSGSCQTFEPWTDAVTRSLVVLKGLTYAPTGGILAAPTMGLPEHIGGVRNWDYRFCWLRDATFTLFALLNAGSSIAARIAMMAMTTRSSISVNA